MTKEAAEEILLLREEWDWEKFRREAAKDILASIAPTFTSTDDRYLEVGVEISIKLTDELIKQLKENDK